MAETTSDNDDAPAPCTACRGTGSVISNLGGTPQSVSCPWCDGSGSFIRGHNAQSHWREEDTSTSV